MRFSRMEKAGAGDPLTRLINCQNAAPRIEVFVDLAKKFSVLDRPGEDGIHAM